MTNRCRQGCPNKAYMDHNTSYFMTKSDLIALKERIEYTIHLIDIDSGVIP